MATREEFFDKYERRLEPTSDQTDGVVHECYMAAVDVIGRQLDKDADIESMAMRVIKAFDAVRRTLRAANDRFDTEAKSAGHSFGVDFEIDSTHIVATALYTANDILLDAEDFHPYSSAASWVSPLILASVSLASLSFARSALDDASLTIGDIERDAGELLKLYGER